jgi:hypothetical protein
MASCAGRLHHGLKSLYKKGCFTRRVEWRGIAVVSEKMLVLSAEERPIRHFRDAATRLASKLTSVLVRLRCSSSAHELTGSNGIEAMQKGR